MAGLLHLTAALRNFGARDQQLLERLEVVGFGRDEVKVLAELDRGDDGLYRGAVDVDPERVSALSLRLSFADGRSRLTQATPLCASRCEGLVVVDVDALSATTRWKFGPEDARLPPLDRNLRSNAGKNMSEQRWGSEATQRSRLSDFEGKNLQLFGIRSAIPADTYGPRTPSFSLELEFAARSRTSQTAGGLDVGTLLQILKASL